jgi:hypothetical protein
MNVKPSEARASVCIGDAMVDSEMALANGSHILLDDPGARPHLTKLSDAITRYGAVASMECPMGGRSTDFLCPRT